MTGTYYLEGDALRFRAESLSKQLDVLKQIRQQAKAAMLAKRSVRRRGKAGNEAVP